MSIHDHKALRSLSQRIFAAAGVHASTAHVVADMLIDAELMGLASHGLQRVPQYIEDIKQGAIVPDAEVLVDQRSVTMALVDGQWNFGQVVAKRASEEAIAMAQECGTGSVVTRGCRHVGRVGAYTEMCAAAGCIGLAMVAGGKEGHWVAPFGGREGRLSTNPIAFAVPTGRDPISMDFSTAIAPEGQVRLLRDSKQRFAAPALVDEAGAPSCDPAALYAADGSRVGAILPFGGDQGYKGFGLGLMVGIMASAFAAPIWNSDGIERMSNCMWLLAIRIDALMDTDAFCQEVQAMADYVCSSAPIDGGGGVMMPGHREFETMRDRQVNGIPIDDGIWSLVVKTAESLHVEVE